MVTQQNFVVKDLPNDWEEVIYISGIAVAHAAQTIQNFTMLKGGRFKSGYATLINSLNTGQIQVNALFNAGLTVVAYGQAIIAASGMQIILRNYDPAVDEAGAAVIVVIKGG